MKIQGFMTGGVCVVVAFALSACATYTPEHKRVRAAFDATAAAAQLSEGTNSITGNAFMRQVGGGVVTCAGETVRLVPATEYARERLQFVYGDRGFSPLYSRFTFEPDPEEFHSLTRTTKCDAAGNFRFDDVADGDYFILVTVQWAVASVPNGGHLLGRASAGRGRVSTVIMAA